MKALFILSLMLLRWLHDWARLLDGLVGVLTFSFVYTRFGLTTARWIARYRHFGYPVFNLPAFLFWPSDKKPKPRS